MGRGPSSSAGHLPTFSRAWGVKEAVTFLNSTTSSTFLQDLLFSSAKSWDSVCIAEVYSERCWGEEAKVICKGGVHREVLFRVLFRNFLGWVDCLGCHWQMLSLECLLLHSWWRPVQVLPPFFGARVPSPLSFPPSPSFRPYCTNIPRFFLQTQAPQLPSWLAQCPVVFDLATSCGFVLEQVLSEPRMESEASQS